MGRAGYVLSAEGPRSVLKRRLRQTEPMSDLVTGEAVPLEVRRAKLPSRALSFTLDALLLGAVTIGFLLLLGQIVPDVDEALAAALVIASTVFVLVVLPTTIETLTRGKSLGKLALGLRVVRDDGGPIRFRHALVRALAGVFADFVITAGLVAVLCSLLNSRDKRIGDIMAGTIVVRERIPAVNAPPPAVDPALAGWASTLELSRLPDELALAARTLLARAPQLAPEVRERLAADLATQMAQVVTPPAPSGVPALTYLATVLGERRRRDSLRYAEQVPQSAGPSGPAQAGPSPTGSPFPEPSSPTDRSTPPAESASTPTESASPPPPAPPPRPDSGFAPPG